MLLTVIALLILAAVLLYFAVKVVPQGEQWTVQRFGRYTKTLPPGLHILIPFVDQVGRRINMMERILEIDRMDVITADNAVLRVDAITFYQVTNAARAAYEVFDLETAIESLTITNIRSVIGSMELDRVLSDRDEINEKLLRAIDEATGPWGVKATRVEIRDLLPPPDITAAMAKQIKAEREKRAEIFEAEGSKAAAVLRAEGRKEAAFLEAQAREREAEAEAVATETLSRAIANGEPEAIQYFIAQKYVESLREIASSRNSKLVVLPVEATSIAGSLVGMTELLKNLSSDTQAPAQPRAGRTPPPGVPDQS